MLDKRQYFAENVGYEIPLLIPGIFFITILSALAALISAVHVQRRGLGGGGGILIGQRPESSLLTLSRQSSRLEASRLPVSQLELTGSHSSHLAVRAKQQQPADCTYWYSPLVARNLELESQHDAVLCKLVESELNISRSSSSKISITKKIT